MLWTVRWTDIRRWVWGETRVVVFLRLRPATGLNRWQLTACHVLGIEAYSQPQWSLSLPQPFITPEAAIRHARKTIFAYLASKRHRHIPDHIEWRMLREDQIVPCQTCGHPLYQIVSLGRTGAACSLQDWTCERCHQTVTMGAPVPTFLPQEVQA